MHFAYAYRFCFQPDFDITQFLIYFVINCKLKRSKTAPSFLAADTPVAPDQPHRQHA